MPVRPCEIDMSANERFSVWMSMYCPGDGQSCGMLMPGDRSHRTASRSGSGIRQRLEQQGVDDAEDRGVGADADGQRPHDQQGQAEIAAERPDGVSQILQERGHHCSIFKWGFEWGQTQV